MYTLRKLINLKVIVCCSILAVFPYCANRGIAQSTKKPLFEWTVVFKRDMSQDEKNKIIREIESKIKSGVTEGKKQKDPVKIIWTVNKENRSVYKVQGIHEMGSSPRPPIPPAPPIIPDPDVLIINNRSF